MDSLLRELEREAACGNPEAELVYRRARLRTPHPFLESWREAEMLLAYCGDKQARRVVMPLPEPRSANAVGRRLHRQDVRIYRGIVGNKGLSLHEWLCGLRRWERDYRGKRFHSYALVKASVLACGAMKATICFDKNPNCERSRCLRIETVLAAVEAYLLDPGKETLMAWIEAANYLSNLKFSWIPAIPHPAFGSIQTILYAGEFCERPLRGPIMHGLREWVTSV